MGGATAQVTPLELTTKMLERVLQAGSELLIDAVAGVDVATAAAVGGAAAAAAGKAICGVHTAQHGTIAANQVVFAMGPWTGALLEQWLENEVSFPMEGIKSTSIVFENVPEVKPAQDAIACFCEEDDNACHLELYPRPNGDVYVCGCGRSDHVGGARLLAGGDCDHAGLIAPDPARCTAALKSLQAMTSLAAAGTGPATAVTPDVSQACMRPCPSDGLPVMSAVGAACEGAFVSAGHNCWGILWAPIAGLAMTELLLDGESTSVDLAPFSLSRFNTSSGGVGEKRGRKKGALPVGEQW
jgi:glycine/D-amino acid oxidase-like deaminating enzyme